MILSVRSVAISDGIAVVGANGDDDKSTSGAVYVFEMSSSDDASSWTQVAKLTADDGAKCDTFGGSVAISDGTIVVGALGDDDKGSDSGSVYLFEMSSPDDASSWAQVASSPPMMEQASDYFGCSVAISDGTIVVGAHGDDDKGPDSGAVYLFEKSSPDDASSWSQVAKLTADDGAASDHFGWSVAISDGTIVVGAQNDDDKGSYSGSVYLFEKSSPDDASSWAQVAKLTAADGAGVIISVFPLQSAMVPSSSEHTVTTIKVVILVPRTSSRRALPATSSWSQVAKLKANAHGAYNDHFGRSVAISDGTIVVGAYGDDDKGQILVPRTSSRRALPTTRARGRKWQNSPPTMEQMVIVSVSSVAISDGTIVVGADSMTTIRFFFWCRVHLSSENRISSASVSEPATESNRSG